MNNVRTNVKKKNKKIIIIIGVLILGILIAIFMFSDNNKKELLLSCSSDEDSNQFFKYTRTASLNAKGKELLFNDNMYITILSEDEKIVSAIDYYFNSFYTYDKYNSNDFLTYIKEGKNIEYSLNLNLHELSQNEMKEMLGFEDTSVQAIKAYLEKSGLACEEY